MAPRKSILRTLVRRYGPTKLVLALTVVCVAASNVSVIAVRLAIFHQVKLADILVGIVMPAVMVPIASSFFMRLIRDLDVAEAELSVLATQDFLTKCNNRGNFMKLAALEMARAKRHVHPTACLMLDVDFFKRINDTHGHGVGDEVLVAVVSAITGVIRQTDILGRLGGEEFGLLLPETPAAGSQRLAERIRAAVENLKVPTGAGNFVMPTLSIGIADTVDGSLPLEELILRADRALYLAKNAGRNRVEVAA